MQEFIERFFKVSHDVSATIIITLCIFILGYLITALGLVINRYFERKANRKLFLENLKNLNKSLEQQQRVFQNAIKKFDIIENSPWGYYKVDFFQLDVLKEMNYKEYFGSFFLGFENQLSLFTNKNLKRRAYNRVWANKNIIQFITDSVFRDHYANLEKFNQYGEKRNNAVGELRRILDHLFRSHKSDSSNFNNEEIGYLRNMDKIMISYYSLPTSQRVMPYKTHRCLILPIRILNKKYKGMPIITDLNELALEASHQYQGMELLLRHMKSQYKEYYHIFRTIQKINLLIIKILNLNIFKKLSQFSSHIVRRK